MRVAISPWKGWIYLFLAGSAVLIAAYWAHLDGRHAMPRALIGKNAPSVRSIVSALPLAFELNRGQVDEQALFLSRNIDSSLFLTAQGAVIRMNGVARPLTFTWDGANNSSEVEGMTPLPGRYNYLHGSDHSRWLRNIPAYEKVRYHNLYPGIDLIFYGRQQHLEYDLVVAPGADPRKIRLDVAGIDSLHLDHEGDLHIHLAGNDMIMRKPVVYQHESGAKHTVRGEYVLLAENRVGLRLGSYDHNKPLIIDPVLSYGTYLGGSGLDEGKGVAVDTGGNIYVVGQTASVDFPTLSKSSTDTDAFVAKFDAGGALKYVTYLGGDGTDRGFSVAMDNLNNAVIIVGDTDSTNFPVTDNTINSGGLDAFIAKLSSANLMPGYASYFGGSNAEEALGVAVDDSGNAYMAGATLSSNFSIPLSGNFNAGITNNCDDPSHPGSIIPCSDAYVVKYDSNGNRVFATYLGGSLQDAATAIAVNSAGNKIYLTGITYSYLYFPFTLDSLQNQTFGGGVGDAFIITLDESTSNMYSLSYGTYLGGDNWDQGQAIAVDGNRNIYIVGATNSSPASLQLTNPLQAVYGGGGYDAFAAKLKPRSTSGYDIQYLTYLGGSDKDLAFGVAADSSGDAYVVGETMSQDFRINIAIQPTWLGGGQNKWGDAFVTKINPSGTLAWSTYLGGADDDWASSVALDGAGGIYVAGSSFSTDFPTVNSYQGSSPGNGDATLLKLTDSSAIADLQVSVSATPDPVSFGQTLTYQVTVDNLSTTTNAGGVVVAATLPGGISFKSATPGGSCTASGQQVTCKVGSIAANGSATTTLENLSNAAGNITFSAKIVRANQPDPDLSNNSASVTTIAAVGDSGGGAWSVFELLIGLVFYPFIRGTGKTSPKWS